MEHFIVEGQKSGLENLTQSDFCCNENEVEVIFKQFYTFLVKSFLKVYVEKVIQIYKLNFIEAQNLEIFHKIFPL